jgi:hypothetical protein
MLFKKIIKMGGLIKPQSIAYLGNIPIGILQQIFRLFKHLLFNNLCGRKAGY